MLYVTERCVFALRSDGLELTEVAPGIDIERDILALMDFKPLIPRDPVPMDARIFSEAAMGLRDDMLSIPLDQRFTYDEAQNLFFVNLERFPLRSRADIEGIERTVESKLAPLVGASTRSSTMTISRSCPNCSTTIPRWCAA